MFVAESIIGRLQHFAFDVAVIGIAVDCAASLLDAHSGEPGDGWCSALWDTIDTQLTSMMHHGKLAEHLPYLVRVLFTLGETAQFQNAELQVSSRCVNMVQLIVASTHSEMMSSLAESTPAEVEWASCLYNA